MSSEIAVGMKVLVPADVTIAGDECGYIQVAYEDDVGLREINLRTTTVLPLDALRDVLRDAYDVLDAELAVPTVDLLSALLSTLDEIAGPPKQLRASNLTPSEWLTDEEAEPLSLVSSRIRRPY